MDFFLFHLATIIVIGKSNVKENEKESNVKRNRKKEKKFIHCHTAEVKTNRLHKWEAICARMREKATKRSQQR